MKNGTRVGKGRFHPSRVPGHAKIRLMLDVNRSEKKKVPKPKMYSSVIEALRS